MPEETFETPQPIQPIEPKSTNWPKLFLAAVLGFGLLAGAAYAGYWYGAQETSKLQLKTQNQVTPTPTPTPTPVPVPAPESTPAPVTDPTAGWKTYTNGTNGYAVKIPQDWIVDDHKGVFVSVPGEVTFTPPSEVGAEGEAGDVFRTKVAILVMTTEKIRYTLNTQQQFDEWLTKSVSSGEGARLFKIGDIRVGGLDAVTFVSRSLAGDSAGAYYGVVTWFRKNGANYYLELYSTSENKASQFASIYNQILSTFKFLD